MSTRESPRPIAQKPHFTAWWAQLSIREGDRAAKLCDSEGLDLARAKIHKELGLKKLPGLSSMWNFYHQWPMRRAFLVSSNVVEIARDLQKSRHPKMDPQELEDFGQAVFTAAALSLQDQDSFVKMKQLRQRDRALNQEVKLSQVNVALKEKELALDTRRVELLEKKAALADETEATVRDADLTDEERAQKIKEIYGRA